MGELLDGSPPQVVYDADGVQVATIVGGGFRPITSSEITTWMALSKVRAAEAKSNSGKK